MEIFEFLINEPKSDYLHSKSVLKPHINTSDGEPVSYRQIARVLSHLSSDLRFSHPHLTCPSPSLIRGLCFNACSELTTNIYELNDMHSNNNWLALIADILKQILQHTDVGLEKSCAFTQTDGSTPLFPNSENFDEWDAHRFALALLHHLEKDLN